PRSERLAAKAGPATSISPSTSTFSLRANASTFSATSVAFAPTDFSVRETTHFGCVQPARDAIDVAVEGLHHAENELTHALTPPHRCPTGSPTVLRPRRRRYRCGRSVHGRPVHPQNPPNRKCRLASLALVGFVNDRSPRESLTS